MDDGIGALLFDLGGVVIHTDFDRIYARWAHHAGCDIAHIRDKMRFDRHYERYERGETEIDAFFGHLRTVLTIDISDAQFLEGWNDIFVGEMPGIARLLESAKAKFPLYAFTNTNAAHELCWSVRFSGVLSHFKKIFVSSTIGLRKPDAPAFAHVVDAIGLPAARIMFFDDVRENVEGAIASGLRAVQVKETADIAAALSQVCKL